MLIDIAGLKGVEFCPGKVTVADLERALRKQDTPQPGDAVLIYTGWSKHWGVDNKLYTSGCPGIGVGAASGLSADPMLLGADNWPVKIGPKPANLPVTTFALTVNGIHLLENLVLGTSARHASTSLRSSCSAEAAGRDRLDRGRLRSADGNKAAQPDQAAACIIGANGDRLIVPLPLTIPNSISAIGWLMGTKNSR